MEAKWAGPAAVVALLALAMLGGGVALLTPAPEPEPKPKVEPADGPPGAVQIERADPVRHRPEGLGGPPTAGEAAPRPGVEPRVAGVSALRVQRPLRVLREALSASAHPGGAALAARAAALNSTMRRHHRDPAAQPLGSVDDQLDALLAAIAASPVAAEPDVAAAVASVEQARGQPHAAGAR